MAARTQSCWLCGQEARVATIEALDKWLAVEGCRCGGFYVLDALWSFGMPILEILRRRDIAERIRQERANGYAVWFSTDDGTVRGRPILSRERRGGEPT